MPRSIITVPVDGRVLDFRARFRQPGRNVGFGDIGLGREAQPGGGRFVRARENAWE